MRNTLFTTAAAIVLIAGSGFAVAQDRKEGATPAPAAQQRAPAEKVSPPQHEPNAVGPHNAQSESPRSTTGQAPSRGTNAPSGAAQPGERAPSDGMQNRMQQPNGGSNAQQNRMQENRTQDRMQEQQQNRVQEQSQPRATTGQGAAGAHGAVNLTDEQRSTIRTVIRGERDVQPLNSVNFALNVGTRVPRDVRLHPLPARIIEVYPAWRGYEYVRVHDQIVVIDPRTLEIVAVLDV
jgi:Protein of unknown function (DUF1236)